MAEIDLKQVRPLAMQLSLRRTLGKMSRFWPLYVMLIPGILYFVVFRYWPIYGLVIAFKTFRVLDGITGSPWVGFANFQALFDSPLFMRALRNTLIISALKLIHRVSNADRAGPDAE